MKKRWIVALLGIASAAAAAIPYERPLTAPVYTNARDYPGMASIASDGRQFLVAWHAWLRWAIYAARIAPDGTLLDPTGIHVADLPLVNGGRNDAVGPWVFRAGDAFVIFWNDGGLQSARLGSDGTFIDAPHLALADAAVTSIAMNGARFVAAYDGGRLAVLDLAGGAIERDIAVPDAGANAMTLTSNGSGFLATWVNTIPVASTLSAVALDAAGHPAGATRTVDVPLVAPYVQASNGSDYLIVCPIRETNARRAVHISAAGELLESRDLPVAPSAPADALSWTGSEYFYTCHALAMRLSAAGVPLDSVPTPIGPVYGSFQSSAVAGGKLLLTWSDIDVNAEVITLGLLAHTSPAVVSISALEQRLPDIAFSGRNYLVVWNEGAAARAARVDLDGRVLDPNGIALTDDGGFPHVVFDGKNFVVTWWGNALYVNAIDPDSGALLSHDGIRAAYGRVPVLASDGNVTMLVYDNGGGHLQAQRLNHQLQPLEAALTITPSTMIADNPSVAWSGKEWLVAFNERASDGVHAGAVRISPSMTLLDTQPIFVARDAAIPHVASSGDDFLIAWTRGGAFDVFARHMLPDGTLGNEIRLGGASFYLGSAIWTGTRYAVSFSSPSYDAVGVTLGKFGATAPQGIFKISATPDREFEPVLAAGDGRITAAYDRQASEPLYGGALRLFVRDARPMHGRTVR